MIDKSRINILIACEESQRVCTAFRLRGFNAFSCDIIDPSGNHPEWHIKTDVKNLINKDYILFRTMDGKSHCFKKWDLIIAFPPCTHLAVSGARHFEKKRADGRQKDAIIFFCQFFNCNCKRVVIENPIGIISGKYIIKYFPELAIKYNLPIKPTQIIQPYEYGHKAKKATCLWIKNLQPLKPTEIVNPEIVTYTCKSGKVVNFGVNMVKGFTNKNRAVERSKTFPGIAEAMAEQWGNEIIKEV